MSEIIKCNTGTLASDESKVSAEIKKINQQIADLRALMGRLDGMWDGDASEAFKTRVNGYINSLDTMVNEGLVSVANYEDKAVTEYNTCERDISGLVSSISV